jgi:peptidoglycan/xylan/chitin deacetylase (PgdA/CDA1 family)
MNTHASQVETVNPLSRLRSRLAPLAKTALLRTGAYAAVRGLLPGRRAAILRYHAVCGDEGAAYADPGISVSPEAFEEHARYLSANYTVLPLPEVVERIRHERPLPRNCVVITFDDGYADNLKAAQTLNRYGISGTFYITAGCMVGGEPFWPSELRTVIPAIPGSVVHLRLNGSSISVPLHDEMARRKAVRTMGKLFKANSIPVREGLRQQLREAAGQPTLPNYMLRWEDIAEMHRLGMTIGAHTVTHPNLPNAGLEAATREIVESKARIEQAIGSPVTMFSYPNGGAERYYTPELQKVVAESGYTAAASSYNAFATATSDLYALERIEVEERLEDLLFALEIERFAFKPAPRHFPVERGQ